MKQKEAKIHEQRQIKLLKMQQEKAQQESIARLAKFKAQQVQHRDKTKKEADTALAKMRGLEVTLKEAETALHKAIDKVSSSKNQAED